MSIEIRNLVHIYGKDTVFETKAIDDMSFTIESGEFFGIIGHTGSGKSTLIQHFNSLLKPDSGQILLNGEDINGEGSDYKRLRQRVGLVFQYPEHQLFETTVAKDIGFGPKNLGLSENEINIRVNKSLNLVGLDESYLEKSPFDLSGGEKRRIAIAGVLAMEPEILILDEPTAGLDPKGREEILNQIKDFHEALNNTIIIVSHSMEDISRLCTRLAVLEHGKLKYIGSPKEVFRNAYELEKIGLAAPQISYLVRELNKKGFKLDEDVYSIEDASKEILKAFNIDEIKE